MKRTRLFSCVLAWVTVMLLIPNTMQAARCYPHGDVTYDSIVNINDVTRIIDHLLQGTLSPYADIDGDMKVTIDDVTQLIDHLLMGKGDDDWDWAYTGPEFPDSAMVFEVNGFRFAMMPVGGGTLNTGFSEIVLRDFYMSQTEVTVGLWKAVMGTKPRSLFAYYQSPWQPVDGAMWWEWQDFISRLNELTGCEFHMPTCAQWRYAALGGKYTHGYRYAGSNDIDEVAWYMLNYPAIYDAGGMANGVALVGLKKPNELGLYDMSGNVAEWMYNGFLNDGELLIPPLDDPAAVNERQKAIYGGSIKSGANECELSYGIYLYPGYLQYRTGLRLALGPDLSND